MIPGGFLRFASFPMIPGDFLRFPLISNDSCLFLMNSCDFFWFLMIAYHFLWFPEVSYDFLWFLMILSSPLISYDFLGIGKPHSGDHAATKVPQPPKSSAKSCADHARPRFWSISGGGCFLEQKGSKQTHTQGTVRRSSWFFFRLGCSAPA